MSNESLVVNRLKDIAAVALVGDGVLALVYPQRRVRLWKHGPGWWERVMGPLAKRPNLVRALAAAEVGVGLLLAARERAK